MKDEKCEVLIVGAGPVGLLAAIRLAETGIGVRIIDQQSCTAGYSYACGLHPGSLELLDGMGLGSLIASKGRTVDSIAFYRGGDCVKRVSLSSLPGKFPFVVVLEQSAFEDILEEKLRRLGVKVDWNHRLRKIDPAYSDVQLAIEKLGYIGHGYMTPEFEWAVKKELTASSQFVIGADGQHSHVRHLLDIPYYRRVQPDAFAVFRTKIRGDAGHEVKIALDHGLVTVMWPLGENDCRWSFQVADAIPKEDFPQKERDRLIIADQPGPTSSLSQVGFLLERRAPWFKDEIVEVEWTTRVQFERRIVGRFGQGRCWLAGDAAHQTSPVGMQSMNVGLREGVALADILAQILRGTATVNALSGYDAVCVAEWHRLLGISEDLHSDGSAEPWALAHRSNILGALPASGKELVTLLGAFGLCFR